MKQTKKLKDWKKSVKRKRRLRRERSNGKVGMEDNFKGFKYFY